MQSLLQLIASVAIFFAIYFSLLLLLVYNRPPSSGQAQPKNVVPRPRTTTVLPDDNPPKYHGKRIT